VSVLQVWSMGTDRILRGRGRPPRGAAPSSTVARLLEVSSVQIGTAPPDTGETYDPLVWRYGAVYTYEPGPATTGVPSGTVLTTYTGPTTITVDNTVIDSKYIPFHLIIRARNVRITRCEIVGAPTWSGSESALVDHRYVTQSGLLVADCTIHQQVPNLYINAFIGHHATVLRCNIYHCVDGFGIYNNNSGTNPLTGEPYTNDGDVIAQGNWWHDSTFFTPDPTHSDNVSHNDFVQFHGGKRSLIGGNRIDHFMAPASDFPVGSPAYNGAAAFVGSSAAGVNATATTNRGYGQGVYMQSLVSQVTGNTIEFNWFHGSGGQIVVRVPGPNIIRSNRVDRSGKNFTASGSQYQIRANVSSLPGITGLYTNVWNDTGAFVTYDTSNPSGGTGGIRTDAG
jgi:hypothetical protein